MIPPRRRLVRPALLALAAVVIVACGASPTSPSNTFSGEAAVRALVEQIVDTMEQQSFRRDVVDWPALRAAVLARAAGVATVNDALPAIQLAFQLLGDSHGHYSSASGRTIGYSTLDCSAPIASAPSLPPTIGYVRVRSTGTTAAEVYAGAVQDAIRAADRDDTAGWIVDLRGNSGGSTYAMVAGVGPILGDGAAGSFVNLDGTKTEWGYRSGGGDSGVAGATSSGVTVVIPSTLYRLRRPNPRVAVLSDRANVSAGESTLISFIGRPDTRVFGTATCGLSQGVAGLPLQDGGTLWLARSIMADRSGHLYGGIVAPDETIADAGQLIARAVEWLLAGG